MKRYAIIVAGGSGTRMGGDVPKQFMLLAGLPLIMHTINRFTTLPYETEIIVVLPAGQVDDWSRLCREYSFDTPHRIAVGGAERFHSVKSGLALVEEDSLVAIHDGVRPLVSQRVIEECFAVAALKGNAIPVVAPSESVRLVESDGKGVAYDRSRVRLVQTPQVFRSGIIKEAYQAGYLPGFTDDATVVERLGIDINMVDGNSENIKITTPSDLAGAEALIGSL